MSCDRQVLVFRFVTLVCCGTLLFPACGGGSTTPVRVGAGGTGGSSTGGAGASGGGGHGGGGGSPTDGGAGGGGHGGAPSDGGQGGAPADASPDGAAALAWRAFLPLAAAATSADGGVMGTTNDESGNGYNATFFGPTVTFVNASMNLTGAATETVVIPAKAGIPVIDVSRSYSVSAWVTLSNVGNFRTVVGGEGYNVSSFFLQKRGDMGNVWAFTVLASDASSAVPCIALSTVAPVVGTQYHIAATRDGTTGLDIIYVNGAESGRALCPTFWSDTGIMGIGHGVFGGGRTDRVQGSIAEVGLIDRVLTAAEIADLFHKGRAGGGQGGAPGDGGMDAGGQGGGGGAGGAAGGGGAGAGGSNAGDAGLDAPADMTSAPPDSSTEM